MLTMGRMRGGARSGPDDGGPGRGLAGAGAAQAHPHVWIKVEATLLYENGAFTGIDHKWTFDEAYTTMAVAGLDKNQDGVFDREELAELAKVNVDALKDFQYFTRPTLAGEPLKVGSPSKYWLEHKGGRLALHFRLPFASPVLTEAIGSKFAVYDPSFFIAFHQAGTERPVRLSQGAPESCQVMIAGAEKPDELAAPGTLSGLGSVVSIGQTVSTACGGTKTGHFRKNRS